MAYVDFLLKMSNSTKRDYVARVVQHDKATCSEKAIQYGADYWDGERQYGYGGYKYDGRWKPVAEAMIKHYGLKPGMSVLDVGCGKGYLLYELMKLLPGSQVAGLDLSAYAIENAKEEIKPFLTLGTAASLPYPDKSFDFVYSLITFHNLYNYELKKAFQEVERVGRGAKHVAFETYRNEREKANLLYWQLTCRTFWTPAEWEWFMKECGYTGDYSYIVFE